MARLPFYMEGEVKELLEEIISETTKYNEKYIGFVKEVGSLTAALLIKRATCGNAIDKKMFESAKEPIEKLVAQALYPGLLYIYYPKLHELEIYGLGIKSKNAKLKQIDKYEYAKELIVMQYEGDRIPFDFYENEIIGSTKDAFLTKLFSCETNPFAPAGKEEEYLIKKLYNEFLKQELFKKGFKPPYKIIKVPKKTEPPKRESKLERLKKEIDSDVELLKKMGKRLFEKKI